MLQRHLRSSALLRGCALAVTVLLFGAAVADAAPSKRHAAERGRAEAAPRVVAVGEMLFWNRVGRARAYVVARRAPGGLRERFVVRGTSTVTPRSPGQTVRYRVRAKRRGARWARAVSIAYPTDAQLSPGPSALAAFAPFSPVLAVASAATAPAPLPAPPAPPASPPQPASPPSPAPAPAPPQPAPDPEPLPAPEPPPVPAPEPTPAPEPVPPPVPEPEPTPAPAPEPEPVPPPEPGPEPTPEPVPEPPAVEPAPEPAPPAPSPALPGTGIVAGASLTYEQPFVVSLGARTARLEVGIGTPASQLRSKVDAYASAGVRPLLLAGFNARLPSTAEAQNLASWAAEFGPGGTFWQGKSYPPGVAVTHIEFGNETSYSYQFADTSGVSGFWTLASYEERARTYALRFQEAHAAIAAANPSVGLLAIGEADGGGSAWTRLMFEAVPQLGQLVAGWTIHPYGPRWRSRMDAVLANARAQGAPDAIPLWVTEWGLSTDDGRCLSDNYGWDPCMTYEEAADTVDTVLAAMRERYGERLATVYVYQAHDQQSSGASSDREHYFGALRADGSAKGAYTVAIRAQLAAP